MTVNYLKMAIDLAQETKEKLRLERETNERNALERKQKLECYFSEVKEGMMHFNSFLNFTVSEKHHINTPGDSLDKYLVISKCGVEFIKVAFYWTSFHDKPNFYVTVLSNRYSIKTSPKETLREIAEKMSEFI